MIRQVNSKETALKESLGEESHSVIEYENAFKIYVRSLGRDAEINPESLPQNHPDPPPPSPLFLLSLILR